MRFAALQEQTAFSRGDLTPHGTKAAFGEGRCLPPQGNSPEPMCRACEAWFEKQRDVSEKAVEAALGRFMAAIEALPSEEQARVLERLLESVTWKPAHGAPERCLLCGWTDGCKPGCATEAIAELL